MNEKCVQSNGRLSVYGFAVGHNETAQDGIVCLSYHNGTKTYTVSRSFRHKLGEKIYNTRIQSDAYKIFNSWKK